MNFKNFIKNNLYLENDDLSLVSITINSKGGNNDCYC